MLKEALETSDKKISIYKKLEHHLIILIIIAIVNCTSIESFKKSLSHITENYNRISHDDYDYIINKLIDFNINNCSKLKVRFYA